MIEVNTLDTFDWLRTTLIYLLNTVCLPAEKEKSEQDPV